MSVLNFLHAKAEGRRLSMVTCYDYTFARLLAKSAIDGILIGDSAAMVMHGHNSTLAIDVEMMRLHTAAVVHGVTQNGAPEKFIVADMPFLSNRKGVVAALDAAQVLMGAGAHAVKLEGIDGHEDVVERLVGSGIPVMGHLGMQPQSVNAYGGFRVQGRTEDSAQKIIRQARELLGMNIDFQPKFSRKFVDVGCAVKQAITQYDAAVKDGSFPSTEESYA